MLSRITENIYAFYPKNFGSNVFIILGSKITLIDSSLSLNAFDLINALKQLNVSQEEVQLILHSHGHADHFANDLLFPNALIRMHEFDAAFVNKKDFEFTCSKLLDNIFFPSINSFFKENEKINLGKLKLKVLFTAGHTKGSVCFFEEKQKILFSGDTLFEKSIGRTDLISGNFLDLKNSILKLEKLDFSLLLAGHGKAFNGNQKENIEFIKKTYL